jgi:hypothetical protein
LPARPEGSFRNLFQRVVAADRLDDVLLGLFVFVLVICGFIAFGNEGMGLIGRNSSFAALMRLALMVVMGYFTGRNAILMRIRMRLVIVVVMDVGRLRFGLDRRGRSEGVERRKGRVRGDVDRVVGRYRRLVGLLGLVLRLVVITIVVLMLIKGVITLIVRMVMLVVAIIVMVERFRPDRIQRRLVASLGKSMLQRGSAAGLAFNRRLDMVSLGLSAFDDRTLDALAAAATAHIAMARPPATGAVLALLFGLAMGALFRFDQRLTVGDRNLVVVRMNFAEGEEAMPVAAIFDEGGLQRGFNPRHLGKVDIAAQLLALGGFEVKFFDAIAADHDDPGLFRVRGVDQHFVGHF